MIPAEIDDNQPDESCEIPAADLTATPTSPLLRRESLRSLLYGICALTDFAVFLVIFTASRTLADRGVDPWYLGVIGAGLSFTSGIGSLIGGWLASHWNGRAVFVCGGLGMIVSIVLCMLIDPQRPEFLPGYWFLGIAVGFIYPPLVGWLNQGEDAHTNQAGVSRRLIYFCIAWNFGMMCGQLGGGEVYQWGPLWTQGAALGAAVINLALVLAAVWLVTHLPPVEASHMAAEQHAGIALAAVFKRISWIANLGGVFGGSLVIHLLPNVMAALHIAPDEHGRLLAGWRAVIIATYVLMHFAAFWHYRLGISLLSQLLGAAGLVVISLANSPQMLMAGLALLGQLVGFNYFSGLYYSTAGSSHETRALAAGIHEATLAAGMAVGTLGGGFLGSWIDPRLPYSFAAFVIFGLIGVQLAAWQRWKE